ncbi:MAG: hypothetical protein BWY91_02232 [bacterium ADurb.BinA028]|nr:MAG: hypothetical protein BWY91_02232 [bacterium ADurb.BinA028]
MIGAIRASATPTAAYVGWPGLVSGPRKLKAVGTPNSRRVPATWRIEGWNCWAKQKVMPTSWASASTRAAGSVRSMPRASRTSADPERLEAARLPCLTTETPAAAHTIAAMVEMFTVWARSPPVPTTSRLSSGAWMRVAWASISSARPRISSTVSPLACSAMRKPAIWEGVAPPLMISPMAQAQS